MAGVEEDTGMAGVEDTGKDRAGAMGGETDGDEEELDRAETNAANFNSGLAAALDKSAATNGENHTKASTSNHAKEPLPRPPFPPPQRTTGKMHFSIQSYTFNHHNLQRVKHCVRILTIGSC